MKHGVIDFLGGMELLEKKLYAGSFLTNCRFSNEDIELGFSFYGNAEMNFVTFKRLGFEYRHLRKAEYDILFYKVSWFRIKHIQTIENVAIEKVKEQLEVALDVKLW